MNRDDDPKHWKFGIFYFNKNDKRIFVPKRVGWGWTVNFSNPESILVAVIILFTIVFIASS